MSKINITEADIGRKFVTKSREVVTIKDIDPHDASYPVKTDMGSYTRELKYLHFEISHLDFSHWVKEPAPAEEPAPPTRTAEWWATFHAVLPAVVLRHATSTDYESMVATATEITNEAHK